MRRELEEAGARSRDQADALQALPEMLRQMFSATARRGVGPLALRLIEHLLRPEQAAIFVALPNRRRLSLASGSGLPAEMPRGFEIEYGHGRVGHVAESLVAMDEADFRGATTLVRRQLDATATRGLRADVVAPIAADRVLLGVVCAGGIRTRYGQEKRLLKLVADLTAVALGYVTRMRSTDEAVDLDGLTGVFNRRYFDHRLVQEIQKAEREGAPLSLLILDLDHFKQYNRSNGHVIGDEVLRKIGQLLKTSIREDDVAARYNGAEFVVLYPRAGKALATRLAHGLRHAIEAFPFQNRSAQPNGRLTVSGGVATFPEDSSSPGDLLRCADQALYEAKAAGGNRVMATRTSEIA
jgi:diguanylate cyclase (GGDEF)-like protein